MAVNPEILQPALSSANAAVTELIGPKDAEEGDIVWSGHHYAGFGVRVIACPDLRLLILSLTLLTYAP